MPAGIRKGGVRTFNMPEGRQYLTGQAFYLAHGFESFTFSCEVTSNSLIINLGAFELSDFVITNNSIAATIGEFEASFDVAAGASATLNVPFSSFEFSADLAQSGSFNLTLGDFTCSLKAGPVTTLSFDLDFQAFSVQLQTTGLSATDDTTADYQVWVVNRDTKQHAIYTQYPVESIVEFNGKLVAAFEDGIYELGGTDDDGTAIAASLRWAPSEFGSRQPKRIDSIYINGRIYDQCLDVVLSVDEDSERVYTSTQRDETRRVRILPARGVSGHAWQLGIDNVLGGDFELYDVEVATVPLSRHTR